MHVRTRDHLGVGPLSPVEMGSGQRLIVLDLFRGSTVVSWIQVCIV